MARVRAHVWVSGRVQGVFFRHETASRARSRGVGGWVSNIPSGHVEAVFEGDEDAVRALIDWCWRGPRLASVTGVEVAWEAPEGNGRFEVR